MPSFPLIYNEDWLFRIDLMSRSEGPCKIGYGGTVRQSPKNVFQEPRAMAEEAGDLLAETLMNLFEDHGAACIERAMDENFWKRASLSRQEMISKLQVDLDGVPVQTYDRLAGEPGCAPADVLGASLRAAEMVTPAQIVSFIASRRTDGPTWAEHIERASTTPLAGPLSGLKQFEQVR